MSMCGKRWEDPDMWIHDARGPTCVIDGRARGHLVTGE